MSVSQMPGKRMSPSTVLAQCLEDSDDIKAVWIITKDANDCYGFVSSTATNADTAFAAMTFHGRVTQLVLDVEDSMFEEVES